MALKIIILRGNQGKKGKAER